MDLEQQKGLVHQSKDQELGLQRELLEELVLQLME